MERRSVGFHLDPIFRRLQPLSILVLQVIFTRRSPVISRCVERGTVIYGNRIDDNFCAVNVGVDAVISAMMKTSFVC